MQIRSGSRSKAGQEMSGGAVCVCPISLSDGSAQYCDGFRIHARYFWSRFETFIPKIHLSETCFWRGSGQQYGGTVETAVPEVIEGLIGVLQGIGRVGHLDADFRGDFQELQTVLTGQVGDGDDFALFP